MALVAVKRALSPKACSAARRGAGNSGGTSDGSGVGADLGESAGRQEPSVRVTVPETKE